MPHIDLDDINLDDLSQLSTELNDFFSAFNTYQWAYCEGHGEYAVIGLRAEENFEAVRQRIKNLAIDLGIHGEFLDEYAAKFRNQQLAA